MTNRTDVEKRQFLKDLLLEIVESYANEIPYHPWVDEKKRWLEMVACVFFTFGGEMSREAQHTVAVLDDLGLLGVAELAGLSKTGKKSKMQNPHLDLIRNVMGRLGFANTAIDQSLDHILNLARSLESKYEGRIQVYLRHHGERMLAQLQDDLPDVSAQNERLRYVFTMWLQNVLTMPVFLDTPATHRFCKKAGCTLDDLHEAVDRLDITASLLDDMLDLWAEDQNLLESRDPGGRK